MQCVAQSIVAARGAAARRANGLASRPGARSLASLRVAGVPEHFFAPFHISKKRGLYEAQGIDFSWDMTPQGTGLMAQKLREDSVDLAVMVSEGAVAQVAAGAPFKIVGTFVQSPLRLGVHVRAGRRAADFAALRGTVFGVSRMGSNSHLMSHVLAHQQGWEPKRDAPLKIVNTLQGAREAMEKDEIGCFVWERFTTKHLVDSGEWELVGELPSPWHPFLIVASDKCLAEKPEAIRKMIETTRPVCQEFKANEGQSTFEYLKEHHHLSLADAKNWLDSTEWACRLDVARGTLDSTQEALVAIDVLAAKAKADTMLAPGLCKLVE